MLQFHPPRSMHRTPEPERCNILKARIPNVQEDLMVEAYRNIYRN